MKSLNGKVCLTVTAALPDLPRKCSSSVSVTPRNNKQVFHFRALLTICKAGIMKRSCLVPVRQAQSTDSHLQKEQHRKRKTRRTGRAGDHQEHYPVVDLHSTGRFTQNNGPWHLYTYSCVCAIEAPGCRRKCWFCHFLKVKCWEL